VIFSVVRFQTDRFFTRSDGPVPVVL
jgi:hypothetical protein